MYLERTFTLKLPVTLERMVHLVCPSKTKHTSRKLELRQYAIFQSDFDTMMEGTFAELKYSTCEELQYSQMENSIGYSRKKSNLHSRAGIVK